MTNFNGTFNVIFSMILHSNGIKNYDQKLLDELCCPPRKILAKMALHSLKFLLEGVRSGRDQIDILEALKQSFIKQAELHPDLKKELEDELKNHEEYLDALGRKNKPGDLPG